MKIADKRLQVRNSPMSDCVPHDEYACVQCALDLHGPCAADPTFGLCLGCHVVRYCSPACQRDAWCVVCQNCQNCRYKYFNGLQRRELRTAWFSPAILCPLLNGRPDHKQACKKTRKERAAAAGSTTAVTSAGKDVGATAKRTASAPSVINADAAADLCAHCTAALGLLVCQGCHQAGYCSLACQQGAWWVVLSFSCVRSYCIQFTQVSNCGWCVASCVQGGPQESVQGHAHRAGSSGRSGCSPAFHRSHREYT